MLFAALALVSAAAEVPAADVRDANVLDQVPRDALGFVVVRNLTQADARAGRILGAIGSRLPGPLALLRSIANVDAGLDPNGDLLVALLPPESNSEQLHIALWLPVADYGALVRAFEGDADRHIAAITLAGEDLLVRRLGSWAVVMDPGQRERLEHLSEQPSVRRPQLAAWSDWLEANDAAIVVLPGGMRAAWDYAANAKLLEKPAAIRGEELFGGRRRQQPSNDWTKAREWVRTLMTESPAVARAAAEADVAAVGLQLDEAGGARAGVRLDFANDIASTNTPAAGAAGQGAVVPPNLFAGGPLVIAGSGTLDRRWAVPLVAPYVRQVVRELAQQFGSAVDATAAASFRGVIENLVGDVAAFSVLIRPGSADDGVYTNQYLALRVVSAEKFLRIADGAVQQWNELIGKSENAALLELQRKPVTIGAHRGTQYSVDMAAALGDLDLPELRTSMVKLFGPGGEFRLQFVAIDESTVLLAAATEAQVASVLGAMNTDRAPLGAQPELQSTRAELAAGGDWLFFISPAGYTAWLRRQMEAVLGAVIGGPAGQHFPESPPVGITAGVDGRSLWLDAVVPAETMRAYGSFSRRSD